MHFPTNQECKTKRRPTLYSENKAMGATIAKKKTCAREFKMFQLEQKKLIPRISFIHVQMGGKGRETEGK